MSMCSLPAAGQLVAKGRHSVIVRLNLTLYTALSGAQQSARTECSIWGEECLIERACVKGRRLKVLRKLWTLPN